jgi:hypothetical protein
VESSRSFSPVSALYAIKRPLFSVWNTRLPAVVNAPPPMLPPPCTRHFSFCVDGSIAMSQLPV